MPSGAGYDYHGSSSGVERLPCVLSSNLDNILSEWLCAFVAFALLEYGAPASLSTKSDLAGGTGRLYLEEFYLNGLMFRPYEGITASGRRQFRLSSTPELSPEREAATIRYLIDEGLSETMWPQIGKRIEDEASWALFA